MSFTPVEHSIALLLDPGKQEHEKQVSIALRAEKAGAQYLFVGGSTVDIESSKLLCCSLRKYVSIPVILYPGNATQVHQEADACLFMSMLSGRNPEYLIQQQVLAAPMIKASGLRTISTAYLLVSDDANTSVAYISNTRPIPAQKHSITVATALAADFMGFSTVFLDAGSGSSSPVLPSTISAVRAAIPHIPLIVGGGIQTAEDILELWNSGANVVVLGNVIEQYPEQIEEIFAKLNK